MSFCNRPTQQRTVIWKLLYWQPFSDRWLKLLWFSSSQCRKGALFWWFCATTIDPELFARVAFLTSVAPSVRSDRPYIQQERSKVSKQAWWQKSGGKRWWPWAKTFQRHVQIGGTVKHENSHSVCITDAFALQWFITVPSRSSWRRWVWIRRCAKISGAWIAWWLFRNVSLFLLCCRCACHRTMSFFRLNLPLIHVLPNCPLAYKTTRGSWKDPALVSINHCSIFLRD